VLASLLRNGVVVEDGSYTWIPPTKLFRRVRKHEGETWTPDRTLIETRDDGLLCKTCHRRIKWKDLDITYELRTDLFRLWWCSYCGLLVKEDNMEGLALTYGV
jgi:hypothetical protein